MPPVRYALTEKTTYVDENGNPIALTTVKSGLPVTIYHTRSDRTLIANKVIQRKAPSAPEPIIE